MEYKADLKNIQENRPENMVVLDTKWPMKSHIGKAVSVQPPGY